MSQGAVRPETARDREERRVLETDLAESPLKGRALPDRPRNFRPDAESAVRPSMRSRRRRVLACPVEWPDWSTVVSEMRLMVEM